MKQKFELTMTTDYARDWDLQDALREFIQNAIDQSVVLEDNEMSIDYDGNNVLSICNKSSILKKNSLLLGCTSKKDSKETIGQFGEGYKIALLVLTRLGKKVVIYNYGNKEIWTAKFVKSRRYEGEKILTVYVETLKLWEKAPDNNLTIEIEGINAEDYKYLVVRTLQLQTAYKRNMLECHRGNILLDDKFKGKIFVNGLYINTNSRLNHGYDIKPEFLTIGRDRNLVDSFDIYNATSLMWKDHHNHNRLYELLKNDCEDVKYIKDSFYKNSEELEIGNKLYEDFKEEYGENAIPVSTEEELNITISKYSNAKPVVTSRLRGDLITASPMFSESIKTFDEVELSRKDRYKQWKMKYKYDILGDKGLEELDEILEGVL